MDFLRAMKALKRWRFTFLGVSLLTFALVALAPNPEIKQVIQYQSGAKILLTPPSGNVSAGSGGARGAVGVDMTQSWFADPTVLTELLQSEELLGRVSSASEGQEPWNVLKGMITVEPLSQSAYGVKLFKLTVTGTDPKQSQKITRLVTEEFSNYVQELSAREFASTRKFIEELVVEAEQRRMQAEENLGVVREKYLGAPSDTQVQSQQMSIDNQRQQVSQTIPGLQAEAAALKAFLDGQVNTPPWTVVQGRDGSLSALEAKVSEDRLKLQEEREIYTEENEKVQAAKARLAASEQLYRDGMRDQVTSLYNSKVLELQQASAHEQSLSSQLNTLLASQMTPDDRRAVQKLERELNLWEENHLSLLQQLYQARVVEQSSRRQGSVNILEQPMPGSPIVSAAASAPTRSKSKKIAMALPFCLLLGAGAALLREYLSTSMKLRPRIEEALELPVIAVIPATPSELTVDWERFKRPMQALAPVVDMVTAGMGGGEPASVGSRAHGNGHSHGKVNGAGRSADDYRPGRDD